MAETFLHELFQPSNFVQSDTQERKCDICLQETGLMSGETGLIELQVRLPCRHIIGSGCIAVWLKDRNSCPICRRELFPAQPQPNTEDDMMWDQGEEDQEEEDEEEDEQRLRMLEILCQNYCLQLDLDCQTIEIAQIIIQKLLGFYPFSQAVSAMYERNAIRLVGLAIYISSCFTDHPRSPREICRVEDVNGDRIQDSCAINGDDIRSFYGMIYERREQLINDRILESLEVRDVVWPPYHFHDGTDDQIECRRDLPKISALCANGCATLQVSSAVDDLAQHIVANVVRAGFHTYSYPRFSRYVSDSEVAAVSIYTASHLIGPPISRVQIQSLLADEDPDIRSIYMIVRQSCKQLVREEFQETFHVKLSSETLEAEVAELGDEPRQEGLDEATAAQGETGSYVATATTRLELLKDLCNGYCSRLEPLNDPQTLVVAQRLAERFDSSSTLADRCLESTAAICVYIACHFTGRRISYALLEAATEVSINSIHSTHMRIIREIHLGRAHIEDIVGPATDAISNPSLLANGS